MGGPPEAKCRALRHVVSCYTMLWEDYPLLTHLGHQYFMYASERDMYRHLISALTSVTGIISLRGKHMANKDTRLTPLEKVFLPADCPLDLDP